MTIYFRKYIGKEKKERISNGMFLRDFFCVPSKEKEKKTNKTNYLEKNTLKIIKFFYKG